MKSLELTEEHKSKLLEMCKVLFPEYKGGITLHESAFNTNQLFIIAFIDKDNDYIPNCDLYIHWFEFCVKYIIPKLSIDSEDRIIKTTLFVELPNPIDYIYEYFKNIENEEI